MMGRVNSGKILLQVLILKNDIRPVCHIDCDSTLEVLFDLCDLYLAQYDVGGRLIDIVA